MGRLVVSITTTPARINSVALIKVLISLNHQTRPPEAIYLAIPKISSKNVLYPDLDPKFKRYCTIVSLPEDYGPICKILGGVIKEPDSNTIIVTCDDDAVPPKDMIEKLETEANNHADSVIGAIGIRIGSFPGYISVITNEKQPVWKWWITNSSTSPVHPVDILCGYGMIAYRRGFLDFEEITDHALSDRDIFTNDDILLSGLISKRKIPRIVCPLPSVIIEPAPGALSIDNNSRFGSKCLRAIQKCKNNEMYPTLVQHNILKTVTAVPIIICFILIVVVFMLVSRH